MLSENRAPESEVQPPIEEQVRLVAEQVLSKINQTASHAERLLAGPAPTPGMALASNNSLNSNAIENLASITETERKSLAERRGRSAASGRRPR